MPWYYAEGAVQNGPITDEEFASLVGNGKVRADTLVWREGMAAWEPYSNISGAPRPAAPSAMPPIGAPPVASAGAGEVVCHECGKVVPKDSAIQYGTVSVCATCKPVFVQKLREGAQLPAAAVEFGGFWIRFVAKFIDGLILGVVLVVPLVVMGIQMASSGQPDPFAQLTLQLVIQLGYMAVQVGFNTFFIGKFGATPGKMAMKLRVVMSDGSTVSYGRAFGRACAEILSNIICSIGYIIAAFDSQKRALHDHICDTRVIRRQ